MLDHVLNTNDSLKLLLSDSKRVESMIKDCESSFRFIRSEIPLDVVTDHLSEVVLNTLKEHIEDHEMVSCCLSYLTTSRLVFSQIFKELEEVDNKLSASRELVETEQRNIVQDLESELKRNELENRRMRGEVLFEVIKSDYEKEEIDKERS